MASLAPSIALGAGQAPSPRGVTVTGLVTTRDGVPLARVRVAANDPSNNRTVASVLTDDRGQFAVVLAEPATRLLIMKSGHATVAISRAEIAANPSRTLHIRLVPAAVITGRVLDQYGEPVSSIQVGARLAIDSSAVPGRAPYSASTDDFGEFRIGGLPEGRYVVSAARAPASVTLEVRPGDVVSDVGFTIETATEPASPDDVKVPRADAGTIRGRIITASGRPVVNAMVRAIRTGVIRLDYTDADGRYEINGLSAGDYRVEAMRTGYITLEYGQADVNDSRRLVTLRREQTAERIDITLHRGAAIAGIVVDDRGEPMQDVMVEVLEVARAAGRERARRVKARMTDDQGRFRVFGLLPGEYLVRAQVLDSLARDGAEGFLPAYFSDTVRIDEAARIAVAFGRDAHADLTLRPAPVLRISGTVTNSAGKPVRGPVTLLTSGRSGAIQVEPVDTLSDPDGSFAFTNVAPGRYIVQAYAPSEFVAQPVEVTAGNPSPLLLRTSRGTSVTGRVRVEGAPVAEARYSVIAAPVDLDRSPLVSRGGARFIRSPDGTFQVIGIIGPHRLVLNSAPPGWYLKSVTIKGVDVADTPFDFPSEATTLTDAEIVLSASGAAIAGRVTDDQASSLDEYAVIVFPTQRDRWYPSSRYMQLGLPSDDGSFLIEGLPPGDYWFAAVDSVDSTNPGEWQTFETLEALVPRATRITISEGEVHRTTLRLIRR